MSKTQKCQIIDSDDDSVSKNSIQNEEFAMQHLQGSGQAANADK